MARGPQTHHIVFNPKLEYINKPTYSRDMFLLIPPYIGVKNQTYTKTNDMIELMTLQTIS